MATSKFEKIYTTIKNEVINGTYNDTMQLPTETELSQRFSVSRNTIRKAIQLLNEEGLVYSVKGRGVVILENMHVNRLFFDTRNFHGLNALSETLASEKIISKKTKIIDFKEVTIDDKLSQTIAFPLGERCYYIERVRIINNKAMLYDCNYFKKRIVKGLTKEIAIRSVYNYIEQELDFDVVASKTISTIKSATEKDYKFLDLEGNNCVGERIIFAYSDTGELFEHSISRYIPNEFSFVSFNQRNMEIK